MQSKWVSIWGNAVSIAENRPESFSKNITLRYPVRSAFPGTGLRLTLDNYCGTEQINIDKVTVYNNDLFYDVTFDGNMSCSIAPKASIVSDDILVNVNKDDTLYVSLYLSDYTQMRSAVYIQGPLSGGQYAIGDESHNANWSIDTSRKTNIVYFLSDVSLLTEKSNRCILCYGDSITAQDWPDYLALRCNELGINNTSVIRKATSGSRILREYSCITYESYGLKSTNRFLHEIPSANGVDTIIIQQGINDIIHPVGTDVNPFRPMSDLPTIEELIDGFKWYIAEARKMGLKVYAGTLLPIEGWRTYAPFRDELRNQFNDFLRTTDLLDGCIDFDVATRNPDRIAAFSTECDSGDHLHPSSAGYKTMAEVVPTDLLTTENI